MREFCCSYDLAVHEHAPFAILLKLVPAARSALLKCKDTPTIKFGPAGQDGVLCIAGQEYSLRSQPVSNEPSIIRHPAAQHGEAVQVGTVHHKWLVQATNGGPAAGRASANGISLMQKAVMLEEEDKKGKELEARKRQQAGDGSSRLVAGKTTAPEKFRITGKHKQDGGGTQAPFLPARAAQPPLPPPTATGEKAPVAPQNPTGEMFEAARKDGLRGCIIALLSPPGLKMGPSKMEQLIKKTFEQLGKTPPAVKTVHEERRKVAAFIPPGFYHLKEEIRQELASRGGAAERRSSPASSEMTEDDPQRVAAGQASSPTSSLHRDQGARTAKQPPAAPPPRPGARKRPLNPANGKIWSPQGAAKDRLAAIPSTIEAQRKEKEARESMNKHRDGTPELPPSKLGTRKTVPEDVIAAKTAPAKERKRRSTLQGAPEPHATAKKRRGAATPSAGASAAAVSLPVASAGEDPHGRKPCNSGLVKQKSDSSSLLAQPLDWFFTEHSNRAPKVYEKVTTNDQFLQYQSEYKAKYETLLGLNKVLQEHKHLVKVLKKQGEEGHERILGLWRDKGAYLLAMDAAFKTLTKELIEIKGLARSFLEKLQRAK